MSVIDTLNTERLANRIRRILEQQRAQRDLEPWQHDQLRELINLAWQLESRLEVWEDYMTLHRGGAS